MGNKQKFNSCVIFFAIKSAVNDELEKCKNVMLTTKVLQQIYES